MTLKFASAGKVGSKEALEQSLAQSDFDGSIWVRSIPSESEITVRFLTDPDEWFEYREHWGQSVKSYFACTGKDNDCPGCNGESEQDQRTSKRYLANALDVEAGRVIPLKLPVDLVNRLRTRWDRYDTLTDRDYILSRTGKGLNTIYDLDPMDKDSLDISQYEKDRHDLEQILIDQWKDAWESDRKEKIAEEAKTEPHWPSADEDVVDDEDVLTLDQVKKMKLAELEEIAEQLGIEPEDDWRKADFIAAIEKHAE